MLQKSLVFPWNNKFSQIPAFVFDILLYASLSFIFLGCLNLFAAQGILILIGTLFFLAFIVCKAKFVLNIPIIFGTLFCVCYSISNLIFTKQYFVSALFYSLLIPVVMECFELSEDKEKFTKLLLGSYVGGLFGSFVLVSISTFWYQGIGPYGEVLNSFWTSETITRTGISLYIICAIGCAIALTFIKSPYRKTYTLPIYLFVIIFSSIVSIKFGNRSFLIPLFIMFFGILSIKIFDRKHGNIWTFIFITYMVIFITLMVLYLLIKKNVMTLPESWLRIKVIKRIFEEDLSYGRQYLLSEFFAKFYKYPFGGLSGDMVKPYVHNLFLDFYTYGGFPSFLIAVTFLVFLIKYLYHYLSNSNNNGVSKSIFLLLVMGIVALGMAEPIYQANPNCFMPLVIVFMYLRYARIKQKNEKQSIKVAESAIMNEQKKSPINTRFKKKEVHEVNSCALVLVAYNKPESLRRSFENLLKVDYLGKKVDLVISIDYSGNDGVKKVANELKWPFGKLIIRSFTERQGLKKHILKCFEYAEIYDAIFVIEDDIYFSKAAFSFGYNAAKFYANDDNIAGISLYTFQQNWQNLALRFEPFRSEYDNYFVRLSQSWGEVLTRKQWLAFKEWYLDNQEFIKDDINVESVNEWPESSWMKYFHRYCILRDKYFVYPYIGLSSNFNGVGIHNSKSQNDYQIELQDTVKEFKFQPLNRGKNDSIIYDEYLDPVWIYKYLYIPKDKLTIDLWCTKRRNQYKEYVLTCGYYGKKYVKSYSLSLHPIELSIINNIEGKGIYLYRTTDIKNKRPRTNNLLNYSLRISDWRRLKFYSLKLFFRTLFDGIRRKMK